VQVEGAVITFVMGSKYLISKKVKKRRKKGKKGEEKKDKEERDKQLNKKHK
jgi:hypothetical protein